MRSVAIALFLLVAAVAADVISWNHPSVPEPGQYVRFRGGRGLLSIAPVDGADFLVGQRFDISIELHSEDGNNKPSLTSFEATINNQPLDSFFNASYVTSPSQYASWTFTYFKDAKAAAQKASTTVYAARVALRGVHFSAAGSFDIVVKAGSETVEANWVVRAFPEKYAQNVILFIGDGMAPSMISAARFLSHPTTFGKFGDNKMTMEKLPSMGRVATNGYDSMITDSANSASAYNTGHKAMVNALGTYTDTSSDSNDDPKVETLAEIIRRERPEMCIGIVTTSNVQDATPAALFAHTRSRSDSTRITAQMLQGWSLQNTNWNWDVKAVRPDVVLAGGGAQFVTSGAFTNPDGTKVDYAAYEAAGYKVVNNATQMMAYTGSDPLLGIFVKQNLETFLDRNVYKSNLLNTNSDPRGGAFPNADQPNLDDMVKTAIALLERRCGSTGYYLMVEGASIDKSMHPLDFDRGLADLIEFDNAIKYAVEHTDERTAIIVTADHAQGFDVSGTVDRDYFVSQPKDEGYVAKRDAVGNYELAGWPNGVLDSEGRATKWENRFRLASGKVDSPGMKEDYKVVTTVKTGSPLARVPSVNQPLNGQTNYVANPDDARDGIEIGQTLTPTDATSVHTLQSVDIYCRMPSAIKHICSRAMDNIEVFYIMAEALGVGIQS
ncbi:alkaline-phosphatase-like protein [Cladochytrium replicatum]|nr:alkaline-phosphatase-like protein [Cladochytrium replicatum]